MKKRGKLPVQRIRIHAGSICGVAGLHSTFTMDSDTEVDAKRYRKAGSAKLKGWQFIYKNVKCWCPVASATVVD